MNKYLEKEKPQTNRKRLKVEHNNPVAAEKKGKEIIHIHTNTTYSQQERDLRLYTPYKEENNSTLRNTHNEIEGLEIDWDWEDDQNTYFIR